MKFEKEIIISSSGECVETVKLQDIADGNPKWNTHFENSCEIRKESSELATYFNVKEKKKNGKRKLKFKTQKYFIYKLILFFT